VRTDAWHTSCLCRYANALAATQLIAKRQENEVAAPARSSRTKDDSHWHVQGH